MASRGPAATAHEHSIDGDKSVSKRDRTSIGSKPLSFHQKKRNFTGDGKPTNPDRLDRLRKDALEDFNRATVERPRSVQQMAAMFARSASADGINTREHASPDRLIAGEFDYEWRMTGGRMSPPLERVTSSSSVSSPACTLPQARGVSPRKIASNGSSNGTSPVRQAHLSNYSSFSSPSTTDLRALDLKQQHLDEARALAGSRSANVKDIASAFRGESKPENVEVFHKRHAEQEAAYRCRVVEGKETLKKTSQGTDAMYSFVLKLNLATTEGKERFMRRWAIGRIANGEPTTPMDGWKFLQSLGIDVVTKGEAHKASFADSGDGANSGKSAEAGESGAGKNKSITSPSAPARGRHAVRRPTGGRVFGSPRASGMSAEAGGGSDSESVAWETALSRAVGGLVRVDPDASAQQFVRAHRRRRSGSEPRRVTPTLHQAPETCRPTRTKAFWGSTPARGSRDEDKRGRSSLSLSPSTTPPPRGVPQMWKGSQDSVPGLEYRGVLMDRRISGASDGRLSDAGSCPGTPTRGLRLALARMSNSPSRFSLSPGRRSEQRPSLTPTEEDAERNAAAALSAVAEWDSPMNGNEPLGLLQLPERLLEGGSDEEQEEEREENNKRNATQASASERQSAHSASTGDHDMVAVSDEGRVVAMIDDETGGSEEEFEHARGGGGVSEEDKGFFESLGVLPSGGGGSSGSPCFNALTTTGDGKGWTPVVAPKSPQEVQEIFERAIRLSEVHVEGPGSLSDGDDETDAATIEYNDDDAAKCCASAAVDRDNGLEAEPEAPLEEQQEEEIAVEQDDEQGDGQIVQDRNSAGFGASADVEHQKSRGHAVDDDDTFVPCHLSEARTAFGNDASEMAIGTCSNANVDTSDSHVGGDGSSAALIWNVTLEVDSFGGPLVESSHGIHTESSHSMRSADLMCCEVLSSSDDLSNPSEHLTVSEADPESGSDVNPDDNCEGGPEAKSGVLSKDASLDAGDDGGEASARDHGEKAGSLTPVAGLRGRHDADAHSYKDLKIAVDADMEDGALPASRLEWDVNDIVVDTPKMPSRHDDDDDDDDDIDVGDQATQLQDGASPIINVVSRTVDSANYPPQKTMPAGPTEVKNRKENAIGSLLAGAAEDGGRASMTLTPGLLDQSDPAYWDGLAEMMRTPSSFKLDAQVLAAVQMSKVTGSENRKASLSPAFMCPASPASSFTGSDGSLSDRFMDEDEKTSGDDEIIEVEDDLQVDVGEENKIIAGEQSVASTVPEETGDTAAGRQNVTVCSSQKTQYNSDVGVESSAFSDTRCELEHETNEQELRGKVSTEIHTADAETGSSTQAPEDDRKKSADSVNGDAMPSANADQALDPDVAEALSLSAGKKVEETEANLTEVKKRSMTGQTEDTSSPASRRTSPDRTPPAAAAGENTPSRDSSERSTDEQVLVPGASSSPAFEIQNIDAVGAAFPSTPVPSCGATPPAGQPMKTPVSSPASSTDPSPRNLSEHQTVEIDTNQVDVASGGDGKLDEETTRRDSGNSVADLSAVCFSEESAASSASKGASLTTVPENGLSADGDVDYRSGEEEETEGRGSSLALKVTALDPYEDFDAIHDRLYGLGTPMLPCNLAFCRPRTNTFNNPSTTGSGDGSFSAAPEDVESTGGITPGGPLSFLRSGLSTFHDNSSTSGSRPGFFRGPVFFPGSARGGYAVSNTGQPGFYLLADIFGFCRPGRKHNSDAVNSMRDGLDYSIAVEEEADPLNSYEGNAESMEKSAGAAAAAAVVDAVAEEEVEEPKDVAEEAVADPLRHYMTETLGLGCEVS